MRRSLRMAAVVTAGLMSVVPNDALHAQAGAWDPLIHPRSVGPVSTQTSEADLIAFLGAAQVRREDVQIGEGFCAPGSRVFPGTPDEIEITWTDSTYTQPAAIEIAKAGGKWRTARGVRAGMTLTALEELAGAPITFSGFGWDYGGGAQWAEDGLELGLRLFPERASSDRVANDPRYPEILGDRSVSSDHPVVRAMTIHVERLTVSGLAPRRLEYECRP